MGERQRRGEPTRVLVSGATGRVGGAIVSELLARGHTVRALTRTPSTASLPAGVEVVGGDLTDPSSLDGVFDGIDAAHLLAVGAAEVSDPDDVVRATLERAAGVSRLTVLDGLGSVPLADAVVAAGGTNLAGVEFMSNALWWAEGIREEGVIREAFAEVPSTVVHEADIAAVAAAVLTCNDGSYAGRTVTITGPEALTVHQRAAILGETLGRTLRVEEPTREQAIEEWRTWGFDDETIAQFLAHSDAGKALLSPADGIIGRPAHTFGRWARENADAFR